MVVSVEVLRGKAASPTANAMLKGISAAARFVGDKVTLTETYEGKSDWLVLFGAGAAPHNEARNQHVAKGRHVLMFDLGYFNRKKVVGHIRMSIDEDHPQKWLSKTEPSIARWNAQGIRLREDYDPQGPIILVGLGRKSRDYLGEVDWEVREYERLKAAYPDLKIIYRPKPGHPAPPLPCPKDETTPITELLKGASLAACRHSNVSVDAVVAGVPFEAIDGAAMYLKDKPYTKENRLDFLRRLAHWQWRANEATACWSFAKRIVRV